MKWNDIKNGPLAGRMVICERSAERIKKTQEFDALIEQEKRNLMEDFDRTRPARIRAIINRMDLLAFDHTDAATN